MMHMPLWLRLLRLYGRYAPVARGKGRITKLAYKRLPRLRQPVIAPISGKITAEFYPWQWADFCTLVMGVPEIYTLAYFQSLLEPTSVVFDIGAYIGAYAFTASRIATSGSVHIFEPNPESAQRIRNSIRHNSLTNTQLNECAVGDKTGLIQFHIHKTPTESSLLNSQKSVKIIDVPVQTIDKYCQDNAIPKVNLLKIDVEGAELLVLRGADNVIKRFRPIMIIELHREQSISFGYTAADTVNHLQEIKYALFTQKYGLTTRPKLVPWHGRIQDREIIIAKPM